jgi:hypothetical protein
MPLLSKAASMVLPAVAAHISVQASQIFDTLSSAQACWACVIFFAIRMPTAGLATQGARRRLELNRWRNCSPLSIDMM